MDALDQDEIDGPVRRALVALATEHDEFVEAAEATLADAVERVETKFTEAVDRVEKRLSYITGLLVTTTIALLLAVASAVFAAVLG